MPEPLEVTALRQMIADARAGFAADVDGVLDELRTYSQSLTGSIGDVGRVEAWHALRLYVLERFDRRLSGTTEEAETLRLLLRQAYVYLTDANHPTDFKEFERWKQRAEPFVRS